MTQLAITINVSGRVVCERRRCGTKKAPPVAHPSGDGGGGALAAVRRRLRRSQRQQGRVVVRVEP